MKDLNLNKEKILIIKAGGGYFEKGVSEEGYRVIQPYKGNGVFMRILREICFRLPFLPKKIWYDKSILGKQYDYILVWDVLITIDYLNWIALVQLSAQLNFIYGNMIGKSRHLLPSQIPNKYRVWSYDEGDCFKYGMLFFKSNPYFKCFIKKRKPALYDVLFVGADKGRAKFLLSLEKKMQSLGLKTHFVIVKDGRLSRNKSYYKPALSYDTITDLVAESNSVLNVAMPGQTGVTMRDLEALLTGIKLITTNKNIVNAAFYHPDNIYIINTDILDGLCDFIQRPMCPISSEVKNNCDFDVFIQEIISYGE